jgi:hypothetical protein
MNLSAPTQVVFFLSLVLAILAVIGFLGALPAIAAYSFWLAIAAYVVLALGNILAGM